MITNSATLDQAATEAAWLELTAQIVNAGPKSCICSPAANAARWSGYLGSHHANPTLPNFRVLFVGANHNGGERGLLKTPKMGAYNAALSAWAVQRNALSPARRVAADAEFLRTMRAAYKACWTEWAAVWRHFGTIRQALHIGGQPNDDEPGIGPDSFAFVNLARCPDPRDIDLDDSVRACQSSFPLRDLVRKIDARVIFMATNNEKFRKLGVLDGEDDRFVVPYAGGSTGYRGRHIPPTTWAPRLAPVVRAFMHSPDGKFVPKALDERHGAFYDWLVAAGDDPNVMSGDALVGELTTFLKSNG